MRGRDRGWGGPCLVRHADEESVVDDADGVFERGGGGVDVLDGLLEVEVDDVVAVVGDGDLIAVGLVGGGGAHAEDSLAARDGGKRGDGAEGVHVAERGDLDGEGEPGAEALAQLGVVDDDHELLRHDLDHLLAEEGTAAALDEREVRVMMLCGVTVSGTVRLVAISSGIPTHPNGRPGPGPTTVRPDISTRFPMRFFLIMPPFPIMRCLTHLMLRLLVGCFALPLLLLYRVLMRNLRDW